jgi:hypothetical protein
MQSPALVTQRRRCERGEVLVEGTFVGRSRARGQLAGEPLGYALWDIALVGWVLAWNHPPGRL